MASAPDRCILQSIEGLLTFTTVWCMVAASTATADGPLCRACMLNKICIHTQYMGAIGGRKDVSCVSGTVASHPRHVLRCAARLL